MDDGDYRKTHEKRHSRIYHGYRRLCHNYDVRFFAAVAIIVVGVGLAVLIY